MKAMIYRSSKRQFFCKILETGEMVWATALGRLLKGRDSSLVVGDFVDLEPEEVGEGGFSIVRQYPRHSKIYRVIVRESIKKVTAANGDLMIILASVAKPHYKRGVVDRFLVRAMQWGIPTVLVFNKMDLYEKETKKHPIDLSFEAARLEKCGVICFETSALSPDWRPLALEKSMEDLKELLKGKMAILLGQSGVGKSKLISALSDGKHQLLSASVGKKTQKGGHTTTWSEILDLDYFSLIDTPGVKSLSLEDINPEELIQYFPDLEDISLNCQFRNCEHEETSVGCAFYLEKRDEALYSRLESYNAIRKEVSMTPHWKKTF